MEPDLSYQYIASDPNMGWEDDAQDDKSDLMEYLAAFLWWMPVGKHSTFPPPKGVYSDTSNVPSEFVSLDLKGTIDWTDRTLEDLDKVYGECSEANWDGYGATPISRETYSEARKLLRMMPSFLPMPDLSAEPDGEIAFEWYKDKYSVFVISVGGNDIITYAGLFGKNSKTHGTEYLADELPKIIIYNIQRLFP